MSTDYTGPATYSPDDNKLRLYPFSRLPKELYERVRAAGFIWAPKQGLFVAPMWTPEREDLLYELCGEIDDEDKTLVERAEERADRFEGYSERREKDAESAHKAVHAIADGIPFGQPILVGHHSEKRARRDAEKIENGMRRAVKMWETSKYWTSRAAGAIRHAAHKERPDVRARRIKGLESDERRQLKILKGIESEAHAFSLIDQPDKWKQHEDGTTLDREGRAAYIAGRLHCYVLKQSDGSSWWTAYDLLRLPAEERYKAVPRLSIDEVLELVKQAHERRRADANRWLEHTRNRLEYERAMLNESGGLAAERNKMEPGGRVLRRGKWFVIIKVNRESVTVSGHWGTTITNDEIQDYKPPTEEETAKIKQAFKLPPLCNYPGEGFLHITKAEYEARKELQWSDFPKIGRVNPTETHGPHRVRQCRGEKGYDRLRVYLTDEKRKDPPPPSDLEGIDFKPKPQAPTPSAAPPPTEPQDGEKFDAMRETLKAGVQVVTAPQLFPTPSALVARMIEYAEIEPAHRVLEPSAGTGNLIRAIGAHAPTAEIHAVEINGKLAELCAKVFGYPEKQRQGFTVTCGDFLALEPPKEGAAGLIVKETPAAFYDRILMNPPFENGSDIKHIQHARKFLKTGGRLVAICANGPRQNEQLKPLATYWEELPADTFKESGTAVRTAILIIKN